MLIMLILNRTFSSYEVSHLWACFIHALIGEVDDTDTFPIQIAIMRIFYGLQGYVEYIIPNFIPYSQKIDKITISAELGSENK